MKKTTLIKTLAATGILAVSSGTMAATQGTAGATSTGTSDISVTISDIVQISGLADFAFGTYSGTGDATGSTGICAYRNGTGLYNITATGDGAGNAFTITDGTNTIPYSVFYHTGAAPVLPLTSGVVSAQSDADTSSASCGGATNAALGVQIVEADLQAAPAGNYAGTLTLLVEPR